MFTKLVIATAIMVGSIQAQAACNITLVATTPALDAVIGKQNSFTFNNYDSICKKLNLAGATLVIDGMAVVLSGTSIAYAHVSYKTNDLPIALDSFGGTSVQIDTRASQDIADQLLWQAVNAAISNMTIDKGLKALADARKTVKAAYTK